MEWVGRGRFHDRLDPFILSEMRGMPTGLGLAVRSELCGTRGASPPLTNSDRLAAGAVEADAFEGFVDLFKRLLAEVRDAEQVFLAAVEQVVDGEDAALFETVRGPHGEADFGRAHLQFFSEID